jgi:4-hydroxy-3-polyprenylbenzoate decarboxylase
MQTKQKHKVVIAVTGASGALYAKILLEKLTFLKDQIDECGVVYSDNAKSVWQFELENNDYKNIPFDIYETNNFYAPFASGSSGYDVMIICPCTMGTLGRIATGISNDLITRTADVLLKERKKLILVVRETPFSLIHINNMKIITEAGGIICPANPNFYSKSKTIEELTTTVVDRVLDLAGFENSTNRWGNF